MSLLKIVFPFPTSAGSSSAGAAALKSQGSYQKTFPMAGTYTYHCSVHGAAMKGAVTVQ